MFAMAMAGGWRTLSPEFCAGAFLMMFVAFSRARQSVRIERRRRLTRRISFCVLAAAGGGGVPYWIWAGDVSFTTASQGRSRRRGLPRRYGFQNIARIGAITIIGIGIGIDDNAVAIDDISGRDR